MCPRPKRGDAQDDCIKTVRCIWCDIDHVTAEEAERAVDAMPEFLRPSILVRSGSGIHGYWLLERDLQTPEERSQFAAMLPHFYRSFGGDHVQNLSRVLRPPGTMNFKDARKRPAAGAVHPARVRCDTALSVASVFALDRPGGE